jgi:hypothetical protein
LQAVGLFQRVEVFTLDVLDQGHHRGGFVRHVAHQHRHLVQPGQARGAGAALAGNDLVAATGQRAHQHRLHHPLGLDALGELVQGPFVHAGPGLIAAGLQQVETQGGRGV